MTYTVGDTVNPSATTRPGDSTTAASVLVTAPDGTASAPVVNGDLADGEWTGTTQIVLDQPGLWTLHWTITGTGAAVEDQTIAVGPGATAPRRSYATTGDLANWLGTAPPANAARLLETATRRLDDLLVAAVYDVDTAGMPTKTAVADALRDAVCAQVEWWIETGDESGSGAVGQYESVSIGSVSLSRGAGGSAGSPYAAETRRILSAAGLLNQRISVY